MSQYCNKGAELQADLDLTIAQQDYVSRVSKLRDVKNYRVVNSISGPRGVLTDYVGLVRKF